MKLVVSQFLSLDGVAEAPHEWSMGYFNDEILKFKHDELWAADALLLGRVTYDAFAASWPERSGDDFAERMNGIKKITVSTTLRNPSWNNTSVISQDIVAEIAKLKQKPGGDLVVYGSTELLRTLMEHNLVDEYRLLVYPVVLGKGQRLFKDDVSAKLALKESKRYGEAALLTYEPAAEGK
jgi:dihydrofolate reductase